MVLVVTESLVFTITEFGVVEFVFLEFAALGFVVEIVIDEFSVDEFVVVAFAVVESVVGVVVPVANFSTLSWFLDRGRGPCSPGRRPSR
ncbi:unnamed protein product, partial [Rotaria sp. Silwood2]